MNKHCIINPKCKHCDVVYAGELPIMLICHKRNGADVKVKDCEECYNSLKCSAQTVNGMLERATRSSVRTSHRTRTARSS